jgi:hypothetical protein
MFGVVIAPRTDPLEHYRDMKRGKLRRLKPSAVVVVGIVLGRGAQADTILTFDAFPPGQLLNEPIIVGFGSNASVSSPGVTVVGSGTAEIGLTFGGSGGETRWDYYIDSVWSAGQLNGATNGTFHTILFTPTPSVAVSLASLNFHPYYVSAQRFDYSWSVLDGSTVLTSGSISFFSDATKNHPVNINYTGNVGEALTLRLDRTGGDGDVHNIAVDDVRFSQVPEPSTLTLLSMGCLAVVAARARRRSARADRVA